MLKEFQEDSDSRFKRKVIVTCSILGFAVIFLMGLHIERTIVTQKLANKYQKLQSEQKWLSGYNAPRHLLFFKSLVQPIQRTQIESVRQEKISLLQQNQLTIKSVRNERLKKETKGKRLNYVSNTLQVEGNWENISACLQQFNQGYLTAVSDITMKNNNKNGLVDVSIKYRIYYI
jgi:hypothetical protein